jgi:transcriptional regulator with XRE-family HTH domain
MAIKKNVPEADFATVLALRMKERNISIRELATQSHLSYEFIRKLVRGLSVPSRPVLEGICGVLGLNSTQMARLVDMARLRINYGPILEELTGRTPALGKAEQFWSQLKPEQREMVIELMSAMTRKNRESRKSH